MLKRFHLTDTRGPTNGHAPQPAVPVRATEASASRQPPHNLEAEQALLGAILVNNRRSIACRLPAGAPFL